MSGSIACISVAVCHCTKVGLLLKQAESSPVLKTIITMGTEVSAEEREEANKAGIVLYTFKEIEVRAGEAMPVPMGEC